MVRRFTANTAFTPDSNAAGEHLPCVGTFRLTETEMTTEPAVFSSRPISGRAPKWFPGVAISFFTDKGDLVPFTQDVIRYGSGNQGRSYWDINVQPGRCGYQQESEMADHARRVRIWPSLRTQDQGLCASGGPLSRMAQRSIRGTRSTWRPALVTAATYSHW